MHKSIIILAIFKLSIKLMIVNGEAIFTQQYYNCVGNVAICYVNFNVEMIDLISYLININFYSAAGDILYLFFERRLYHSEQYIIIIFIY